MIVPYVKYDCVNYCMRGSTTTGLVEQLRVLSCFGRVNDN